MKYPTRLGLIVSPYEMFTPPTESERQVRRLTNNHHGYYDKDHYHHDRWRSVFRSLITNVYPMFVDDHEALHDRFSPPVMPRDSQMVDVLDQYAMENGQLDLVYEKRTRQSYVVSLEQWDSIKNGIRL